MFRKFDKKHITILGIAFLITAASYIISPIEVRFLNSLTSNTFLIGLTYASGSILFSLISIWLGRLSDRIGRNKFIVLGVGLGIIYPILYSLVINVYQYMGIKLAWAFSAVSIGPIFSAYIQDYIKDDENKAQFMGKVYAVQSIAGAIAMYLGGTISNFFNLKATYYGASVLFVIATLVVLLSLNFNTAPIRRFRKRHIFFGLKYVFSKPQLKFYFAINMISTLNYGIKYMLYPLIIYSLTKSDLLTGSVMATQGVIAFFILIFSGKIQKKFGLYPLSFITLIILAISGNILGVTQNIILFWIFIAVYAVGEALYGPIQAVLLIDNIESEYRGEILGIDSIFDTIFATLGPFFAGILLKIINPQQVLFTYTLLFWLGLLFSYRIYNKQIDITKR